MIHLENIAAGYLPGRDILKDVSFSLEPGAFYFLAGPSGAGKTTLLSLMGLTLMHTRGNYRLFGKDVAKLPRSALPAMRRRVGVVSQDYKLLPHLTVEENVGLPLKVMGEKPDAIHERVSEMLSWVGLKDYNRVRPDVLSGGQKQRVAIARAVMTKPEVLLCDEPSGNLDNALSLRFMYLFEALHKMGTTVMLATHDDFLLTQFRYPVLRLEDGIVKKIR